MFIPVVQDNDKPLYYNVDIMQKAQNGDAFAQLDIGKAYFSAYQTENNCSLAFKWILLSAQQGNMEAQFRLGDLYALGQGTEQSHTHAYEWYTKSALQGYSKALVRIHNLYEDDKYMNCKGYQNYREVEKWKHLFLETELREHRLQKYVLLPSRAMEFYLQQFNSFTQQKELEGAGGHLLLGFMYQHGYGTKRNINRAIEFYIIAAKEGDAEAQYNLGEIYLNQKQSTKHNAQEAFNWFSKAAKNGNIVARCSLAHLYERGIGVKKNYLEAFQWYSLAANMRCTSAQLNIARMYRTGQGVSQDYHKAIQWYNRAAKGGNRAAQNCLDQLHSQDERNHDGSNISKLEYYKNPINGRRMNSTLRQHISEIDDINKLKQLQKLAMRVMKRDINAMYEISIKYRDGVDLPQDDDLSFKWLRKSARGGLEKGQLIMGELNEKGGQVEQNYHKASIWYRKKPLQKNNVFQYNLGMLYHRGNGVRDDSLEASKWFFKSADQGNDKSQYQFGLMREFGIAIRRDKLEAFEWYTKSAYQKNCDAMYRIAEAYLYGGLTERDPSKGIFWYKQALHHGSAEAGYKLIDLYEDYKDELKELSLSKFFLEGHEQIPYEIEAHIHIAQCYLKGYIVKQDYTQAYYFIKKAMQTHKRHGTGWFSTPARLDINTNCNHVLNMYKLVSEQGIDNLEYNIGYAYEFGMPGHYTYIAALEVNISNAIKWYTAASNKGDSRADYRLGVIYEERRNLCAAIDFYTKAIGRKNENAMYRLAHLYLRGNGINQNFEKAYQLFAESHNMNQPYSCLFLKIFRVSTNDKSKSSKPEVTVPSEEDDQNEFLYYSNEDDSNLLSLKMLEAVGNLGNVAVQYQLGSLYGDTESEDGDYSKAAYWFDLASQGGITDAYYRLGSLYEEGQGVERNYSQSLKLYQKAALKNHDEALYRLARMYQYGLGTPINFNKAFILYKRSDEQGNDMAKKVLTSLQYSPNDSSQASPEKISSLSNSEIDDILTMYEHVANDGDTNIQFELGYYYEIKQVESNYIKAIKWYTLAKNSDHIHATYRLGRLYELGLGVVQDYKHAFNLYNVAKNGGCSEATFRLGAMHQNGIGISLDYKQALKFYTEASEQGNTDAQFRLGQMYNENKYTSTDILEVLKWYTKSYLHGNEDARGSLYFLYDNDKPYENFFYKRLAKILISFASNEDYHQEKVTISTSKVYARLSHAYLNGQGVEKNNNLAWHYLSVALRIGLHPLLGTLNDTIIRVIKDNASKVYRLALKQSKRNDKFAYVLLGLLHLGGLVLTKDAKGDDIKMYSFIFQDIYDFEDDSSYREILPLGNVIVPKDYKKAFTYFLKSAEMDNTYSKLIVGKMYQCGYGTKQNFSKAQEYYRSMLNIDSIFSFYSHQNLGLLYAYGDGVNRDSDLAFDHIQQPYARKNEFFNLAHMFYYGHGVKQNHKEALKYLLMSIETIIPEVLCLIKKVDERNSDSGVYSMVSETALDGEAEYLIGVMNEKGQGTRINYKEAFDRFSKAVKCGNKKAENHLKLYYKEGKFINK